MSCRFLDSGALELHFYGELPSAAPGHADVAGASRAGSAGDLSRAAFEGHLAACGECRQALDDLTTIRAALASCPDVATPPGADWSGFMARLQTSVAAERRLSGPAASGAARPPARRTARVLPFAAAAVLALVAIGSLMLIRQAARPLDVHGGSAAIEAGAPRDPTPAATVGPRPAVAPDPALVSLSDQHFERSKLVVLAIATRSAEQPDGEAWAYERDLAATLLGDTRVYRQAAEARGMQPLADVMRDLEFVLLQTAMSQESDTESIERLQRLIRRQDLLPKMNAVYTER